MREQIEKLETNLRAELERQKALLLALDAKTEALRAMSREGIEKALGELARLGVESAKLGEARQGILENLKSQWNLGPGQISLRDICKKLGSSGQALEALRRELLEVAEQVLSKSRKLGALTRHYKEVYGMALDLLFQAAGVESPGEGEFKVPAGMVVNTEG